MGKWRLRIHEEPEPAGSAPQAEPVAAEQPAVLAAALATPKCGSECGSGRGLNQVGDPGAVPCSAAEDAVAEKALAEAEAKMLRSLLLSAHERISSRTQALVEALVVVAVVWWAAQPLRKMEICRRFHSGLLPTGR